MSRALVHSRRATESDRRTRRSITRPLTHPPPGRKICPPAPSALRSEFLPCWEAPIVPSLCSYSALICVGKDPSILSALEIPLFSCQCDCGTSLQFSVQLQFDLLSMQFVFLFRFLEPEAERLIRLQTSKVHGLRPKIVNCTNRIAELHG